jgi:hypothetical protein
MRRERRVGWSGAVREAELYRKSALDAHLQVHMRPPQSTAYNVRKESWGTRIFKVRR